MKKLMNIQSIIKISSWIIIILYNIFIVSYLINSGDWATFIISNIIFFFILGFASISMFDTIGEDLVSPNLAFFGIIVAPVAIVILLLFLFSERVVKIIPVTDSHIFSDTYCYEYYKTDDKPEVKCMELTDTNKYFFISAKNKVVKITYTKLGKIETKDHIELKEK